MWDMVAKARHDDLLREAARRQRVRDVTRRRRSVAARAASRVASVMRRPVSGPTSNGSTRVGDVPCHEGGAQTPLPCGGPR
jgi:hypothetical protein